MSAKRVGVAVVLTAGPLLVGVGLGLYRPRLPFLLGGIQVNEPDEARWYGALRRAEMNTVSLTVYAKQADWDSDRLWPEQQDTAALVAEIRGAKQQGLRVVLIPRVALDHAFARNRFLWHGMIMPASDELLDSWFAKYRRFVLRWAEVAEAEGVDVFGIGSEMNTLAATRRTETLPSLEAYYLDAEKQARRRAALLEHAREVPSRYLWASGGVRFPSLAAYVDARLTDVRDWARRLTFSGRKDRLARINRRRYRLLAHWRELIRSVRKRYRGKITYAANFDQYPDVGFWNDLDLIGINAYFPLREPAAPARGAELYRSLEAGWSEVLCELVAFRRRRYLETRPVLFTEIGYTYRRNSTLAPWAGRGFSLLETEAGETLMFWDAQAVDFEERALAIRALREANAAIEGELGEEEAELLAGLLYWKLSTERSHLEIEPFVHILGSDTGDPLSGEWREFPTRSSFPTWLSTVLGR